MPGSIPACAGQPAACRTHGDGSIPACAGQPAYEPSEASTSSGGSIPACAGQPSGWRGRSRRSRSIPACAGQPLSGYLCGNHYRCGLGSGLSPRVRGNRCPAHRRSANHGSIPACAGQPTDSARAPTSRWVYPRVCGATVDEGHYQHAVKVLSPRVRGNLIAGVLEGSYFRSIPACAGQPRMKGDIGKLLAVYPRVCGATVLVWRSRKRATGLSPRVRGNRCHRRRRLPIRWSIPACAGQPRSFTMIRIMHWVYPRVCGATFISLPDRVTGVGLSPRVRGNHNLDVTITVNDEVYPRVCGATDQNAVNRRHRNGLSPRVRGNHNLDVTITVNDRSIPACAGQPTKMMSIVGIGMGLSPRVRGNPGSWDSRQSGTRSIPACAGQPTIRRRG